MAWLYVIIAGMGEVLGVISMKISSERKSWYPKLLVGGSFAISFFFLSKAMNTLPMGTAYAVWTGIGTAGSTLVGIILFRESANWRRMMYISFIFIGAIGLKLLSS